jgi:hypothetical protein
VPAAASQLSGLSGGSLVSGQLDLLHLDSDVVSVGVAEGVLLDASIAVGGLSEDKALHQARHMPQKAAAAAAAASCVASRSRPLPPWALLLLLFDAAGALRRSGLAG